MSTAAPHGSSVKSLVLSDSISGPSILFLWIPYLFLGRYVTVCPDSIKTDLGGKWGQSSYAVFGSWSCLGHSLLLRFHLNYGIILSDAITCDWEYTGSQGDVTDDKSRSPRHADMARFILPLDRP